MAKAKNRKHEFDMQIRIMRSALNEISNDIHELNFGLIKDKLKEMERQTWILGSLFDEASK
jgi:hypothetical protein